MRFDHWYRGVDLDICSRDFQLTVIKDYDDEDKNGEHTTYSVALTKDDDASGRYRNICVCEFASFKTYDEAVEYLDDLKRQMERR